MLLETDLHFLIIDRQHLMRPANFIHLGEDPIFQCPTSTAFLRQPAVKNIEIVVGARFDVREMK